MELPASSSIGFEKEIAEGGRPIAVTSESFTSEVKTSGPCMECKKITGHSCDCCLSWLCRKHAVIYSLFLIGELVEIRYCAECDEDAIRKVTHSEGSAGEETRNGA